jgi:hypothetical protein
VLCMYVCMYVCICVCMFTTASRTALGPTQPPFQRVPGALSLGVKRPGREADHSPPSNAEVEELRGAIPPLPQYAFIAWCLVKQRDNCTFYVCMYVCMYVLCACVCIHTGTDIKMDRQTDERSKASPPHPVLTLFLAIATSPLFRAVGSHKGTPPLELKFPSEETGKA